MPIRTKPFTEITLADVEDLIARALPEGQTLEYKRQLNLKDRDDKVEFLKDVSALANAAGGTIIYGIDEGEGDERGMPAALEPLTLPPDQITQTIDHLLRDGLDERLNGVLHVAIEVEKRGYVYVIRVPASSLAPHMITAPKSSQPRFYLRANTISAPMNMRQIREVVLQRENAIDRARQLIERRLQSLRAKATARTTNVYGQPMTPDQIALHIVPLHPAPGGWGLGSIEIEERLGRVPPFGVRTPERHGRYSVDGCKFELEDHGYVQFLRGGAVEFQMSGPLTRRHSVNAPILPVYDVEDAVLNAMKHCRALTADGLLPIPVIVQLSILNVEGSLIQARRNLHFPDSGSRPQVEVDVVLEPILVVEWSDSDHLIKGLFDAMWQAWGRRSSLNYDEQGDRIE